MKPVQIFLLTTDFLFFKNKQDQITMLKDANLTLPVQIKTFDLFGFLLSRKINKSR